MPTQDEAPSTAPAPATQAPPQSIPTKAKAAAPVLIKVRVLTQPLLENNRYILRGQDVELTPERIKELGDLVKPVAAIEAEAKAAKEKASAPVSTTTPNPQGK